VAPLKVTTYKIKLSLIMMGSHSGRSSTRLSLDCTSN